MLTSLRWLNECLIAPGIVAAVFRKFRVWNREHFGINAGQFPHEAGNVIVMTGQLCQFIGGNIATAFLPVPEVHLFLRGGHGKIFLPVGLALYILPVLPV